MPLSGLLACIYIEFPETSPFKYIILINSNYLRFIDDILLIYSEEHNLIKITDRLNKIEPTIKFTHELETNNYLSFLDILLIRNNDKLEFKVYHTPTCKNDHLIFLVENK